MIITLGNGIRAEIFRPGMPLKDWLAKQKAKPLALINASLYHSNGKPIGTIFEDGKMANNEGNGYGFGHTADGTWAFGTPWEFVYDEYLTGYTGIVRNGAYVAPSFKDNYVFDCKLHRIGLGLRGGALAICTYDNVTIAQMGAQAIKDGFTTLINLDGGGSRFLYADGKTYYTSSRTPYNAIAFWPANSSEKPTSPKEDAPGADKPYVFLDAGHGGTDTANGSPDGKYKEYEFTFDTVSRLKTLLEARGCRVGTTRDTLAGGPSLSARANEANNAGADVFVSIHSNATSGGWSNARGLCAYTYAAGGEREDLAWDILDAVNAAGVGVFSAGLYHNKSFAVLAQTTMPSVLVECGFHTNREEVALLSDSGYRATLATAICNGICEYLGLEKSEPVKTPAPAPVAPATPSENGCTCPWCGMKIKLEKGE